MIRSNQGMIAEFHDAFERPVHYTPREMSVSERELRIKLLWEEFHEFVVASGFSPTLPVVFEHVEGSRSDYIEMADGLGDMLVLCYGTALHMGFNLDDVFAEIHYSNMSKLGADGKPLINGETPGYRTGLAYDGLIASESGYDPRLPIGKILKGPTYCKPDIVRAIGFKGF